MESAPKSPWKKILLIGCSILLALALGVGVLVAVNWDLISNFAAKAASTLSDLKTVQYKLQQEFHTPSLAVKVRNQTGVEGSILSVVVVNAPFFADIDLNGPKARTKALEIANAARDALPKESQSSYTHYEILFTQQAGLGFTVTKTNSFMFTAADLR
jgi:hypothetical protein